MKLLATLRLLPREKADTLLLLGAALAVLAPHMLALPLWIALLCGATLGWRALLTLRGWRMPPLVLLLPVVGMAMGGIFNTYHTLLGRSAGVAMLVLLLAFKTLEMRARRDLFVVIFLCYFLVLANFFYAQDMGTAVWTGLTLLALLTAQLTFQFTGVVPPLAARVRMAGRILLLAAPLAGVLFVVFPRIHGPLWGMPGDNRNARTGMSDQMAPGNVASLAESDEPAFRVKFSGAVPAQHLLYWRGVVLGEFDGREWKRLRAQRARFGAATPAARMLLRGAPVRYEVTQEASNARWLFPLELPRSLPAVDGNPVGATPELELATAFPLERRVRYEALSHTDFSLDSALRADSLRPWLALPAGANPRARQYGAALSGSPQQRIGAVLELFHRQSFRYTLEPPPLGDDPVDQFLFDTRAGFCEHYASAFTMLMRAAGIPARVVMGYQGGELNPLDGYLLVRQADAHAWSEVWLAGRGWIRIDPTAAIAPERVNRSVAAARARAPFGLAGLGPLMTLDTGAGSWVGQLRFFLSAANNGWNQWILNYTPERQRDLLSALRELFGQARQLAALAAVGALVALALWLRRRRQGDPVERLYDALCRQLARRGLARALHEGPHAYNARVQQASQLAPSHKAAIARFLALYGAYRYGVPQADPQLARTLKQLLNESA